jgi:hypothetical protein
MIRFAATSGVFFATSLQHTEKYANFASFMGSFAGTAAFDFIGFFIVPPYAQNLIEPKNTMRNETPAIAMRLSSSTAAAVRIAWNTPRIPTRPTAMIP